MTVTKKSNRGKNFNQKLKPYLVYEYLRKYSDENKLFEDEYDLIKLIAYDKHKKRFYIKNRHFDLMDIKLLPDCTHICFSYLLKDLES